MCERERERVGWFVCKREYVYVYVVRCVFCKGFCVCVSASRMVCERKNVSVYLVGCVFCKGLFVCVCVCVFVCLSVRACA